MGSVDKSDLKEEYGKDIPYTIEDLMVNPKYNYLMMAHNDRLMGSDGLITSLHTFSYKLAQKDKLSYTDIANVCSLFTIASQRLKGLDSTNMAADILGGLLQSVTSSPELVGSKQSYDVKNVDLKKAMDIIYGEQLHRLQPQTVSDIRDLQNERLKKTGADIIRMSKENAAFLGTNFAEPLDKNAYFAPSFAGFAPSFAECAPSFAECAPSFASCLSSSFCSKKKFLLP